MADAVSITPSTTTDNIVRIAVRLPQNPGEPAAEFSAKGVTLAELIAHAYDVNQFQISGGPSWVTSEKYDVEAKSDSKSVMPAVQAALTDRFKLAMHHETNIEPAYELVVSNSGSKLKEVSPEEATPRHNQLFFGPPGHLSATQATTAQLARALEIQVGRAVVDKTGLTGLYDFNLDWNAPWPSPGEKPKIPYTPTPESIASLMQTLPEELGLELHEQNAPVDTIVIDYAEQPAVTP